MKKTEIVSIRMDDETLHRLRKLADAQGFSVSERVESLIQTYLIEREREYRLLDEVFGEQGKPRMTP